MQAYLIRWPVQFTRDDDPDNPRSEIVTATVTCADDATLERILRNTLGYLLMTAAKENRATVDWEP